ncbi:MAG: class B sortase [Christensenella sp.]|nr:class B sortase [Christensenella sp.]
MEENNQNKAEETPGIWKRHKKMWMILLICAGIAIAAWNIGAYFYRQWEIAAQAEKTREIAQVSVAPEPKETPVPSATQEAVRQIDFATLLQKNSEIVAWIEIPGTKIDYAVVQGKDNVFYLDHDALLAENVEGAIFVDAANSPGFADRNTVLYGHRMNNGDMFAGLHDFEDAAFFDQNRVLYLYLPDGTRTEYEIFAAYETGDEYILGQWDFADDNTWSAYLEQIGKEDANANVRNADVSTNDKILTLSTCVRGEDEKRYLVQAVARPQGITDAA